LTLPAVAVETPAEKELEAAAFAASQSQTQAQEKKAVVQKMERDDAKEQGAAGTQAPAKSGEAAAK
jgi:hypothetical protein